MNDEALHEIVQEHHADIQVIKSDLSTLRASTISNGQKLDRLIETIQRKSGTTADELLKWLQVLVLASALIGGVVAGIVYVAGNSIAADIALAKYRIDALYGSFEWEPKLQKDRQ